MAKDEIGLDGGSIEAAGVEHHDLPFNITLAADVFQGLAGLPRWVPYCLVPIPDKPGKFDKVPHNGKGGISTKEPNDWCTLLDTVAITKEWGSNGVGIVLTGGIEVGNEEAGYIRLVGLDFDNVDFDRFTLPFKSYAEKSPSGNGIRSFVWVPAEWVIKYKDTGDAKDKNKNEGEAGYRPPHCNHCEIYLGTSPRFLTVTFKPLNEESIVLLEGDELKWLEDNLLPADPPAPPMEMPELRAGTPFDLSRFDLSSDQKHLIDGTGGIDRSAVWHGLFIKLIDAGKSREDILATVAATPTLWGAFMEHRHSDEARAMEFARQEIEKAYGKSRTGKQAKFVAFNKAWKGDPQLAVEDDPDAVPAAADVVPAAADAVPAAADAVPAAADAVPAAAPAFGLVSAADLVKKAGPIDWLIRGYIEANTIAQIFGPPGHYKSFAAIDIATAVGSGQDWHGHPVRRGTVVYVCGEGHNGIARRLQALCQERGIDPATLPLMFSPTAIGLSEVENAALLKEAIDALPEPPVLIVVDTLARNFGAADENSTPDMNAFIANIDTLRGDATVLVIHHTGHNNQERERGSSALRGAIDANYKVEFRNDHHAVCIEPLKMKDAELPPPLFLIPKIVVLPLLDEEGQPVTSVVLDTSKDQQLARITEFYKKHPDLGSGERRQNLPKLLEKIIDNPEISQKKLADETGISAGGVNTLVKLLRKHKLIEVDLQLTDAGMKAAATLLIGRLDIIYSAFGINPGRLGKV